MAAKLPNYLRAHRLLLGLSQDEIAFLLGAESGAHICKYERFDRIPSLRAVLGCSIIFNIPAEKLFAGISDAVKAAIRMRAEKLLAELKINPKQPSNRKLLALTRIIDEIQK